MSAGLTTPFQSLKVQSRLLDGGTTIRWYMRRNFRVTDDCLYTVQATQNVVADDWADVNNSPLVNVLGAVVTDATQRIWAKHPRLYYRVKMVMGDQTYYSAAQQANGTLERRDWLLARAIAQRENLWHAKYGGTPGYLLKARQFGPICPGYTDPVSAKLVRCTDFDTNMVVNAKCPTCYGVGIECGYYESVSLPMILSQTTEDREPTTTRGTVDDIFITGRALSWPTIEDQDVWIRAGSDQRYIVDKVAQAVEFRGWAVVQEVTMRLAPVTNVIYSLPQAGSPCPDEDEGYGYSAGYGSI